MGYFIGTNGYYEGDRQSPSDQEVPQRIDPLSTWSGSAWELSPTKWNADLDVQITAIESSTQYRQQKLVRKALLLLTFERAATLGITPQQLLDPEHPAYSDEIAEYKAIDDAVDGLEDQKIG